MSNRSYIVLNNETEDQKKKINQFLDENKYDYERSNDALDLYARELIEDIEITMYDTNGKIIPRENYREDLKNRLIQHISGQESYWMDETIIED